MLPRASAALAPFKVFYPGFDDRPGRDLSYVFLQVEAAAFEQALWDDRGSVEHANDKGMLSLYST